MQTAASFGIEVVADLATLDASLRRAEGTAARSTTKIANDLGRVEKATDRVNATSGRAATATERLAASYGRMSSGINSAATASGRLAAANDNVARSANDASFAAKALAGALAAISAAGIIALGSAVARTGMEMQALERSFKAAAGGAQQGGRELTFVRAEADRLGLSLAETAKQYLSMVAASQGTALQGQGTRDAFVAISTAMTALGKDSEATGRALLAVQQMMSKGKVASEELKGQLGEVLPGAFNLAAQAAGKTTAEFSKMLDDGKVLAEDLIPKLSKKLIELYGAAALEGAQGLQANLNRLSTAYTDFASTIAKGGLNEALNRAAQALVRFMKEADGSNIGRTLGAGIDYVVQALERVPRGFENLGIAAKVIIDLASQIGSLFTPLSSLNVEIVNTGTTVASVFDGMSSIISTVFNSIVGTAVAGYQMVAAAWQALPGVFAEIATNAGNALINGIASAVNYVIGLLNGFIASVNAVGAKLPSALGFSAIGPVAEVAFENIKNSSAGATEEIGKNLARIGSEATSKDYFGGARDATKAFVDGQIKNFNDYRGAMDDAAREQRKFTDIANKSKLADAYQGVAAAGKAAKAANDDAGGSANSAASAYDNLIQRTKDRIEELQLEAQYASKTATEVIKLKLAHDLERAAKKDGTEVTEKMRAEWDKLGGELAEATQNLERTRKAQADLKKAQDATADSIKSFVEDLITGTDGIQGALKSLGKTVLSNSLDALISGKGPLAGITGLAANDNKSQGGLLGVLTGSISGLGKNVEKGAEAGAKAGSIDGTVIGLGTFAGSNSGGLLGIDAKSLTGGLSAIAGLAGAYGTGAAAGSMGQAAFGGAISGGAGGLALAGSGLIAGSLGSAAVLGPLGAALGIGLAVFGNQQAKKQAKAERERQAQENYRNAQADIASFRSQARGEPQDTLATRIRDAETSARKLADVAFLAKKSDEAAAIWADGQVYKARAIGEFQDGFAGLMESLQNGLGPSSPFSTAKDQIKQFGDDLKGFIDNVKTAYGEASVSVDQARAAAADYALTVLNGAVTLTSVATRLDEIQGTGAGLVKVLVDLGWESERAGEAVRNGMTAAIQRVREAFETDLAAKTNDALDKGYFNDARDLLKEVNGLFADAGRLGTDPAAVGKYFTAAAQSIVNGANLTGDAFREFATMFPDLAGGIVEASKALEDASRRLGYLDRLFNATNDNSTLAGQLAAYDRTAQREREEEIKLGGQYIADLEAAQLAERFNIIRDFNKAANDNYRQSLEQAQDYIARFTRSIQEYLDGLRAGSDSPLSPQARLAAAQSQYNTQLGLAQGGDRDALDGITGYASDLLDAAKGFYASSTGFQDIFAQIQSQLGGLPDQLSAEQFIVNAIEAGADQTADAIAVMQASLTAAVNSGSASATAAALASYFNNLDANTDNLLSYSELLAGLSPLATASEQAQARAIFNAIDQNGDGTISRLEAVNATTGQVNASSQRQESSLATANTLNQQIANLSSAISTSTTATNQNVATGNGVLYALQSLNNSISSSTASAASSLVSQQATVEHTLAMRRMMGFQNAFWGAQSAVALPQFSAGGWTGPGSKYQAAGIVHADEYVFDKASTNRIGVPFLDALRSNDNVSLPVMPVPMMGGAGDMRAVVVGLEKVTAAVQKMEASNVRATVAAAEHVGDEVKVVASKQDDAARRSRLMAA